MAQFVAFASKIISFVNRSPPCVSVPFGDVQERGGRARPGLYPTGGGLSHHVRAGRNGFGSVQRREFCLGKHGLR